MKTKEIEVSEKYPELFGYNDRGITNYDIDLVDGECTNCGQYFSGKTEVEKIMFGHVGCPKPNGLFVKSIITPEILSNTLSTLRQSVLEEVREKIEAKQLEEKKKWEEVGYSQHYGGQNIGFDMAKDQVTSLINNLIEEK